MLHISHEHRHKWCPSERCTNLCVMCVRVGLIYSLYHSISFVYFLNELWFLMSKGSLENLRRHRGFLFAEEEAKEREKSCQVNNK